MNVRKGVEILRPPWGNSLDMDQKIPQWRRRSQKERLETEDDRRPWRGGITEVVGVKWINEA